MGRVHHIGQGILVGCVWARPSSGSCLAGECSPAATAQVAADPVTTLGELVSAPSQSACMPRRRAPTVTREHTVILPLQLMLPPYWYPVAGACR